MTALYVLAAEYRDAAERLADLDLDEQTIADTLESLSGDLEVKAANVAMFARNLEATAAAIKEAEAGMASRRKAIEARASGLRRYLLAAMQSTGITKIETPHLALSVRNNPEAVEVFDAAQVPAEFMRQPEPPPPSPDKAAIKEAIKAGRNVAGAKLTRSVRLDVK
jgi:hypothetical protein